MNRGLKKTIARGPGSVEDRPIRADKEHHHFRRDSVTRRPSKFVKAAKPRWGSKSSPSARRGLPNAPHRPATMISPRCGPCDARRDHAEDENHPTNQIPPSLGGAAISLTSGSHPATHCTIRVQQAGGDWHSPAKSPGRRLVRKSLMIGSKGGFEIGAQRLSRSGPRHPPPAIFSNARHVFRVSGDENPK